MSLHPFGLRTLISLAAGSERPRNDGYDAVVALQLVDDRKDTGPWPCSLFVSPSRQVRGFSGKLARAFPSVGRGSWECRLRTIWDGSERVEGDGGVRRTHIV